MHIYIYIYKHTHYIYIYIYIYTYIYIERERDADLEQPLIALLGRAADGPFYIIVIIIIIIISISITIISIIIIIMSIPFLKHRQTTLNKQEMFMSHQLWKKTSPAPCAAQRPSPGRGLHIWRERERYIEREI